MLHEIYCEQFHQKRIVFNPGLSVVLGTNAGDNSIGKSTFLLIVDYVFGGSTYAGTTDIIENVGSHDILIFPAIIIQFFKIQTGRKNPSQKCVYRDCDGFKCLLYDFVLLVIFPNWQAYISRFPICVKACFGIKNSENRLVFLIRHF